MANHVAPEAPALTSSSSSPSSKQRRHRHLPSSSPSAPALPSSSAASPHRNQRQSSQVRHRHGGHRKRKERLLFGHDDDGDDGPNRGAVKGAEEGRGGSSSSSGTSSSSGSGGDVDGSDDTPCSSLSSSSSSSVAVAAWSWVDALDPVVTIVLSGLMALSMVGVLRRCGAVLLESSALEPKEAADLVNDIESDPAIGLAAANLRISSLVITDLDFSATARRASATFVPATLDSALSSKRNYARTQGSTSSSDISNLDGGGHDIENINQERAPKTGSGRDHTSLRRRVKAHLAIRGVRWATLEIDDGVVDEMSG
mmetsp:Transcript_56270/g.105564  ORF Transcript_56270/g.105564 Transcript_56270/m.105564 type:complete len:313 (+) Transcript_56270:25-963(+)